MKIIEYIKTNEGYEDIELFQIDNDFSNDDKTKLKIYFQKTMIFIN